MELPAVELEDRVHAELLENPALEEGREEAAADDPDESNSNDLEAENDANEYDSLGDYLNEDDIPDYKLQENNRSKGEQAEEIPFSDATSFYEILREQLSERNLTEHQRELAEYLIGSLDDDGLLRKSLESISDELAIYAGINATEEELEEALCIIQDFDPAGLGARNLQECLLIQLQRKLEKGKPDKALMLEQRIINECYEEFTRKHWDKIIKKLGCEEELFNTAISEITKLNPRPGASLGEAIGRNMQQIVPDFIVDTYDDKLSAYLTKLSSQNLSYKDSLKVTSLLHCLTDFERISDHSINVVENAQQMYKEGAVFSKKAKEEMKVYSTALRDILERTTNAFVEGDEALARTVEPLEEVIDELNKTVKKNHMKRLRKGKCTIELGLVLSDLAMNYERVADHCSNIAVYMMQLEDTQLEEHSFTEQLDAEESAEFTKQLNEFEKIYQI